MKKISFTELQQSLTPEAIRSLQMIYFAIMSGAAVFLGVIIYIYSSNPRSIDMEIQNRDVVNYISFVHAVVFISSLFLSRLIAERLYREERVASAVERMNSKQPMNLKNPYLAVIRSVKIIYIAILEAPAFLGLVACYLAVQNNVIQQYPYYWLNAGSYAVFIYLLAKDFPTKEKILEIFKTRMGYLLEY